MTNNITRRDFNKYLLTAGMSTVMSLYAGISYAGSNSLEDKIMKPVSSLPDNEKTSWSAYDFTAGKKLLSIDEDVPMQSASMVKIEVALAFFHKVKYGPFIYGSKSKKKMEEMFKKNKFITPKISNDATNWFMEQIGGPEKVQKILQDNYGEMFAQTKIVEEIPNLGKSYKNKSSAHDYSRFLYALWKHKLPWSNEILRLMRLSGHDRVRLNAKKVPDKTWVYHKTGSTAMLCGTMAILNPKGKDGKRYPYTLIGIIEKEVRTKNYDKWISNRSNVIRDVSGIVYTEMKKKYNLV